MVSFLLLFQNYIHEALRGLYCSNQVRFVHVSIPIGMFSRNRLRALAVEVQGMGLLVFSIKFTLVLIEQRLGVCNSEIA